MNPPSRVDLPLFAYGLFRPGEIAYFRIRDAVVRVERSAAIHGDLWQRDGLPLLAPGGYGEVRGALVHFRLDAAANAYGQIVSINPGKQYFWGTATVNGQQCNVLYGKKLRSGSDAMEVPEWSAWDDPLFTCALDEVRETLDESSSFDFNLRPLFRLQMAYMLLWTAIERYASFRYDLGTRAVYKTQQVAEESAFADALRRRAKGHLGVRRSDDPEDDETRDPNDPAGSMSFYYQVRSNAVHRGKVAYRDHQILLQSLSEMLPIFRDLLRAAKAEAKQR